MSDRVPTRRSWLRKWLLYGSLCYWVIVLVSAAANRFWLPDFYEVEHVGPRCYQTDAMIVYVECADFAGDDLVGFTLSLPWYLVEVPMFIPTQIFPFALLFSLLLWMPLLYPVLHFVWGRRAHS